MHQTCPDSQPPEKLMLSLKSASRNRACWCASVTHVHLLSPCQPLSPLGAMLLTCMRFFNLSSSSGVQAPFLLSSTSDIQRGRDCPQSSSHHSSPQRWTGLRSRQLTGPDTPKPVTGLRVQQERRAAFSATVRQESLLGPAASAPRQSRSNAVLQESSTRE